MMMASKHKHRTAMSRKCREIPSYPTRAAATWALHQHHQQGKRRKIYDHDVYLCPLLRTIPPADTPLKTIGARRLMTIPRELQRLFQQRGKPICPKCRAIPVEYMDLAHDQDS